MIIPWHPLCGAGGQFLSVAFQFDQVVEGVDAAQLAGVDQAHEQIADLSPVQGAVEQGVPSSMEIFPYWKLCSLPNYGYKRGEKVLGLVD
jgi:hypothetical protein